MSVWSTATGTVTIDSSEHFSLKKYTYSIYDEIIFNVEYGEGGETSSLRTDKFYLSVCLSGQEAVDFFAKWVEGIPGKVDMVVELRMIK